MCQQQNLFPCVSDADHHSEGADSPLCIPSAFIPELPHALQRQRSVKGTLSKAFKIYRELQLICLAKGELALTVCIIVSQVFTALCPIQNPDVVYYDHFTSEMCFAMPLCKL